jgi:spermidine synthase
MQIVKKQIITSIPVLFIGTTSMMVQIFLIQELISQFYGNEICIGTSFSLWLIFTAIGCSFLPKLCHLKEVRSKNIGLLQIGWMCTAIMSLLFIRTFKSLVHVPPGEMLGLTPMIAIAGISLCLPCLFSGLLYTRLCQWLNRFFLFSAPHVFILESAGAALGGLFSTLLLFQKPAPIQILIVILILNLISATILLYRKSSLWLTVLFALFTIGICWLATGIQNILDRFSYPGQTVLLTRNTPYGNITLTKTYEQINVYQNGLWLYTTPDPQKAEASVHYALLQHTAPESILVISGGPDLLTEILKYPTIRAVDYVEINGFLVQSIQAFIPNTVFQDDPRIHVHYEDARHFLSKSNQYDVILSNLPNPYNNQLNRFYTREFFTEVRRALKKSGIFHFQVHAAENVITPELSAYLSMLSATIRSVFPDITILPGENQHWMASKSGITFSDADLMQKRLRERGIQTEFVRDYYFKYDFSEERIRFLQENIVKSNQVNTDYRSLGYFYDAMIWATTFSKGFQTVYKKLAGVPFHIWIYFIALMFFVIFTADLRFSRVPWHRLHLLGSISLVGFTEISLEMILILGFQILWGATYEALSLLVALYMSGLATGSLAAWKLNQLKRRFLTFTGVQGLISLMVLFCIIGLLAGRLLTGHHRNITPLILASLVFSAGILGGTQFILATVRYAGSQTDSATKAGLVYAADLFGSAGGAFLTAAILVPIWGIIRTLTLLCILNFGMWLLLKFSSGRFHFQDDR